MYACKYVMYDHCSGINDKFKKNIYKKFFEMEQIKVEYRNTTKEKDSLFVCKYQYYSRGKPNKDNSQRYTCKDCTASVTLLNGSI